MRDCHTHPHRFLLKRRGKFRGDNFLGALLLAAALLLFLYEVLVQP